MQVTLKVSNVHKNFGNQNRLVEVLRGISFEMATGEALVIMGPSGSGKSTLLHLIGTLDSPSSGTIEVDGKDPFSLAEPELARFRNQRIGFVFQDHHLLPQYSVLENVLIPTMAFRNDKKSRPKQDMVIARARELLNQVGLFHRLDHRPAELSGGERQRVAVARALINRPDLILCDEPTGNLDRSTAASVASLLLDLHQQEKNVLIVVTHSLELADRFQRGFELNEGKIEPR